MADSGTPLEALETGQVQNTADASRMAAILNELGEGGAQQQQAMPPPQAMQPMPPMPPMPASMQPPMPQMYQPNYIAVDEPSADYRPKKRNMWSSIVENIRDPIFVGILVFILSLPVLHTCIGKYAAWAFAVGGQLSWLGLLLKSLLAAAIFGIYKGTMSLLG